MSLDSACWRDLNFNVRFGHKADICTSVFNVGFVVEFLQAGLGLRIALTAAVKWLERKSD